MNRNYRKALVLLGITGCLAASAVGQVNPLPYPPIIIGQVPYASDWVINCIDPTSKTSPYSTDWAIEYQYDALFGAVMGVAGTVNYSKYCFPTSGVTLNMAGRLGFYVGTDPYQYQTNGLPDPNYGTGGSYQDNDTGSIFDDGLGLTFGTYTGVAGNFSIAKIFQGAATGTTTTGSYFGSTALYLAYWGASDRYFIGEAVNSNIDVRLRVDVLGDAARCEWRLTNTATSAEIVGMWFGQWVMFNGVQGAHTADYVTVPGLPPLTTDCSFATNPGTVSNGIIQKQLPPYLNYGADQSLAYGLQIVLQPSAQIPDQTPADSIDVGKNGWLLGSMTAGDGAMPDVMIPDTPMINGDDAYIEKWNPTQVGAAGSGNEVRTIVAYYRSTWSTSDYAKPYSVVLDAPPVIATASGNPNTFSNATPYFNLIVNIDDTRGFSTNDQSIPLQGVEIDVDLPPGMSDYNNANSSHLVQYLSTVPPQTVEHVTFKVAVDPTIFGNQQYTVTVKPNPGPTKVLTGTIVVASQPYLKLSGTANLVAAPWQFQSGDWATILGANSGLVLDQDFQVFGWDPIAQDYYLQTNPGRGFGAFVIAAQGVGNVALGGSPTQVQDLSTDAPQIYLQPGWNLIANPYNYAIPIGQMVGVPTADNKNTYTFAGLANSGYISGYLAYWDPQIQGYNELNNTTDMMLPNTGYWIFVLSSQPVLLDFKAVTQAFLPGIPDNYNNHPPKKVQTASLDVAPLWSLQLAARSNGMVDGKTSIGQAASAQVAKVLSKPKPPIAPVKNAISSAIVIPNGVRTMRLGSALTAQSVTNQTWEWDVSTQNSGAVTLTWPNLSSLPSNVSLTLTDTANGAVKNLRTNTSYTYQSGSLSTHKFKVAVRVGVPLPVIQSVTANAVQPAAKVSYDLSVNATTTVTVKSGSTIIATLVRNRADASGSNTTTWNYLDTANRPAKKGTYIVTVSSTPSGGATTTKTTTVTVR